MKVEIELDRYGTGKVMLDGVELKMCRGFEIVSNACDPPIVRFDVYVSELKVSVEAEDRSVEFTTHPIPAK
jgi:hypothetical protein